MMMMTIIIITIISKHHYKLTEQYNIISISIVVVSVAY